MSVVQTPLEADNPGAGSTSRPKRSRRCTYGSVSVVAVLPGGGPPGLVAATRRDSSDLAASACPVVDLSGAVAGTGLAHQMA